MDIIIAIIMGILEGLTEFLPISSTGHLILAGHLLGFEGEAAKTFEIMIQLGAILAISILYRRRFINFFRPRSSQEEKRLNLVHIVLGVLPAVIVAFVLHDFIKEYLFSPVTVPVGLVLGGILMIVAEKKKTKVTSESLDQITYKQALGIGLFQMLAVYPGFSRAGSTMSGGLLMGTNQKTAAEFSFLVAVPIMIGATGLDLLKNYQYIQLSDVPMFIVGFFTSFIVASLTVVTFLKILDKVKLSTFAYYRFILAAIVWIFLV